MNEFFKSKLVTDALDGKLPPIEVTLSTATMMELVFWIVLAAVVIMCLQILLFS